MTNELATALNIAASAQMGPTFHHALALCELRNVDPWFVQPIGTTGHSAPRWQVIVAELIVERGILTGLMDRGLLR